MAAQEPHPWADKSSESFLPLLVYKSLSVIKESFTSKPEKRAAPLESTARRKTQKLDNKQYRTSGKES